MKTSEDIIFYKEYQGYQKKPILIEDEIYLEEKIESMYEEKPKDMPISWEYERPGFTYVYVNPPMYNLLRKGFLFTSGESLPYYGYPHLQKTPISATCLNNEMCKLSYVYYKNIEEKQNGRRKS